MKLVTLNIGGPSVDRAARILDYLLELGADVLVLTETRPTDGTRLILNAFRGRGDEVMASLAMSPGERGVAVVTRSGQQLATDGFVTPDLSHRLVAATIPMAEPLTVVGAYVPSRDTSPAKILRKQRFLSQMTGLANRWADRRLVFIGDLNIVGRTHVPRFSAFRAWEYDALESLQCGGLTDAHAELYPGLQVHSWIGRSGAGYRYDYAFVSDAIVPDLLDCSYDHGPRELGISDHAAVVLTLDRAAPDVRGALQPGTGRMLVPA
jgi:exodeoxyribonuclease-3